MSTFSKPYPCVSSFRHFFGQISLPSHKLQLVKSPPFYFIYLKPENGTPFWMGPPCVPWAIKGSTSLLVTLRLQQIELWSLFTDSFTPVLPCLLPVPDRVVPLRMCWTYRRSKGKMVLSSVSKPDETTEKRRTT